MNNVILVKVADRPEERPDDAGGLFLREAPAGGGTADDLLE